VVLARDMCVAIGERKRASCAREGLCFYYVSTTLFDFDFFLSLSPSPRVKVGSVCVCCGWWEGGVSPSVRLQLGRAARGLGCGFSASRGGWLFSFGRDVWWYRRKMMYVAYLLRYCDDVDAPELSETASNLMKSILSSA